MKEEELTGGRGAVQPRPPPCPPLKASLFSHEAAHHSAAAAAPRAAAAPTAAAAAAAAPPTAADPAVAPPPPAAPPTAAAAPPATATTPPAAAAAAVSPRTAAEFPPAPAAAESPAAAAVSSPAATVAPAAATAAAPPLPPAAAAATPTTAAAPTAATAVPAAAAAATAPSAAAAAAGGGRGGPGAAGGEERGTAGCEEDFARSLSRMNLRHDQLIRSSSAPQQSRRAFSSSASAAAAEAAAAAAEGDQRHLRKRQGESPGAGGRHRGAGNSFERGKEERFSSTAAAAAANGTETKKKKTHGRETRCCRCGCPRRTFSDFMQQRLPAWQPVLSPHKILGVLAICGVVFLALGILILVSSNQILECKVNYTQEAGTEILLRVGPEHCTDTSVEEITGEVYLFYELHNFYQNHRRYLKSRSDAQLQGKIYTNAGDVKTVCDPRYLSEDGRVLDPCGLNAAAVFTDAYSVWKEGPSGNLLPVGFDETRETICWHFDLRSRFKNPSAEERAEYADKVDFWLFEPEMRKALHMDKPGVGEGVENSHFIVWMREAALPNFRKVYGKIQESPLRLPFFVRVSGNYDVVSFGGKKFVVVSQASWLGGRNSFLGITYIVVACVCILVFALLGYAQMRNPRHMGDVSWLRKALYADG